MTQARVIVLGGTSNPVLTERLSESLGAKLGETSHTTFPNQEVRVRLLEDVKGARVIVVQSLVDPAGVDLMEFAQLVDAARRGKARQVIGVLPWIAYTLQDHVFRPGEPISAKIIAGFIDSLHLSSLMTVDLHSRRMLQWLRTPCVMIKHAEIFAGQLPRGRKAEVLFVAPDDGALQRASRLAKMHSSSFIVIHKVRDRETGEVRLGEIPVEVANLDCIICDDVVITGSTLIQAAALLKSAGARTITAFCTHPVFVGDSLQRIAGSEINRLVITDSIPSPATQSSKIISIVSIAPLLGRRLKSRLTS